MKRSVKKNIVYSAILAVCVIIALGIGYTSASKMKNSSAEVKFDPVYEKGNLATGPLGEMFQGGDVWVKMLGANEDYSSYDVIFSEGATTHWHKHKEIQLLYALSGKGWYQAENESAFLMLPGDSVEIPAGVKHWHGAAADSAFEHLGLTMNPGENENAVIEKMNPEEYATLDSSMEYYNSQTIEEPTFAMPSNKINLSDLTFTLNDDVTLEKVTYQNRFGIELAGHLYYPKDMNMDEKHPAILIGPPYGGVKEQGPGVYANELAKRGFVALAFDPSYNGESEGDPRHTSSPEIFVEDFSAGVDFLGTRDFVDREKIGAIGICGSGGFALTAAQADPRIKAIATASMYDISSMIRDGVGYTKTDEQRKEQLENVAEGRYETFANGYPNEAREPLGPVENLSEEMADNPFAPYYMTERGYHPRALPGFTQSSTMGFMNFPLMNYLEDISPRPILLLAGENAHSLYYSEEAYEEANEPKELYIVPEARHIDLYDGGDNNYIPFEKLESFFNESIVNVR